MIRGLAAGGLGLCALAASCSEPAPAVAVVDAPYDGPAAYPERRAAIPGAAGVRAFVSNNGSDTISVLDLPSGAVLATVPVGREPVNIDGPHHLALAPTGALFVALSYPAPAFFPGPHSEHSSSQKAGYVLRLDPGTLRASGQARVDPNPGEIVMSDDGSRLVVSHFDLARAIDTKLPREERRGTIAAMAPGDFGPAGTLFPARISTCLAPHGVALSRPDGARAYVACYGEDALAVVDLASPPSIDLVPIGKSLASGAPLHGPYSAALSPAGDRVAVGCTEGRKTALFDAATRSFTGEIFSQGAHYFAAWSADGSRLYIPTQTPDVVLVADPASGQVLSLFYLSPDQCQRPHEVALDEARRALYVVCEGDHVAPGSVLVVDLDSFEVKVKIQVGVYPDRIALEGPR